MANVTGLFINGSRRELDAAPERTLLSVLREDLDLTGSKYGCGEGQCGACTVLIDGLPTRACTKLVGSIGDKQVTTIEGLARGNQLHPLQQAFLDLNAMQCGYCTPGMVLSGVALLKQTPNPTPRQIIEAMDRNICRCGTYPRIIAAIQRAGKAMQEGKA